MRGRVMVGERAIAGARDNGAIVHYDAADRDLAAACWPRALPPAPGP